MRWGDDLDGEEGADRGLTIPGGVTRSSGGIGTFQRFLSHWQQGRTSLKKKNKSFMDCGASAFFKQLNFS